MKLLIGLHRGTLVRLYPFPHPVETVTSTTSPNPPPLRSISGSATVKLKKKNEYNFVFEYHVGILKSTDHLRSADIASRTSKAANQTITV